MEFYWKENADLLLFPKPFLIQRNKHMNWYMKVLKQYADFNGRARRTELWMFVLFNAIISLVLAFVDVSLGLTKATGGIGPLSSLYSLAVLVPSIAVGVRRLHDTGRSGLFLLLAFIPCVGLVLLVFYVQEGEKGRNRFGADPKGRSGGGRKKRFEDDEDDYDRDEPRRPIRDED